MLSNLGNLWRTWKFAIFLLSVTATLGCSLVPLSQHPAIVELRLQSQFDAGNLSTIAEAIDSSHTEVIFNRILRARIALAAHQYQEALSLLDEVVLENRSFNNVGSKITTVSDPQRAVLESRLILAKALRAETLAKLVRYSEAVPLATLAMDLVLAKPGLAGLRETPWDPCNPATPCDGIRRETIETLIAVSNAFRVSGEIHTSRSAALAAVQLSAIRDKYHVSMGFALQAAARVAEQVEDYEAAWLLTEYAHQIFYFVGGNDSVHAAVE